MRLKCFYHRHYVCTPALAFGKHLISLDILFWEIDLEL